MGKDLWTDDDAGEKIEIINVNNNEEEATYISDKIEELLSSGVLLESFAILVRASYQTRAFEDRFIKIGMPYKIIGGTKFYERLEIRDALAFLRIVASDYDDLAFERIINVPKKGIGEKTIRSIEVFRREKSLSLIILPVKSVSVAVPSSRFKPLTNPKLKSLTSKDLTLSAILLFLLSISNFEYRLSMA